MSPEVGLSHDPTSNTYVEMMCKEKHEYNLIDEEEIVCVSAEGTSYQGFYSDTFSTSDISKDIYCTYPSTPSSTPPGLGGPQ